MANGDELPGLLNALGEWVRQHRDPNNGLVFGASVREPTDEQTVKTYGFICDDEDKPFSVFVWQFGNVNIGGAHFTKESQRLDSEEIYNEEFEFEETAQVIEKLDNFFRENPPCRSLTRFADKTSP